MEMRKHKFTLITKSFQKEKEKICQCSIYITPQYYITSLTKTRSLNLTIPLVEVLSLSRTCPEEQIVFQVTSCFWQPPLQN